jgi:hypothetical protein
MGTNSSFEITVDASAANKDFYTACSQGHTLSFLTLIYEYINGCCSEEKENSYDPIS